MHCKQVSGTRILDLISSTAKVTDCWADLVAYHRALSVPDAHKHLDAIRKALAEINCDLGAPMMNALGLS